MAILLRKFVLEWQVQVGLASHFGPFRLRN